MLDSNQRQPVYETGALTTELMVQILEEQTLKLQVMIITILTITDFSYIVNSICLFFLILLTIKFTEPFRYEITYCCMRPYIFVNLH